MAVSESRWNENININVGFDFLLLITANGKCITQSSDAVALELTRRDQTKENRWGFCFNGKCSNSSNWLRQRLIVVFDTCRFLNILLHLVSTDNDDLMIHNGRGIDAVRNSRNIRYVKDRENDEIESLCSCYCSSLLHMWMRANVWRSLFAHENHLRKPERAHDVFSVIAEHSCR